MFLSGIIMLPLCFLLGQTSDFSGVHADGFIALGYLVFIGSILCFSAFVYAIKHLPPSRASIYAYINPIIAVFLGWLILDERLNVSVGFGTAITIIGVYMVNNEFRKQTNRDAQTKNKHAMNSSHPSRHLEEIMAETKSNGSR